LLIGFLGHFFSQVQQLEKALNRNPEIKMSILLDCLRGTRGGDQGSSASILKRLVPRASVYLFHTPYLRGLGRLLLPERVNEVIGLQHMKLLIFDNHVIITG
uniref:CDP-diacylglycerol--glycerol-3-phosphate 3-phosphatidyltransferase n=1 Tax=Gongylonema pulchrum TaxID=637853 RepID=A0A183ECE9_9BILA